jgi:hypothetical protein
MQQMIFYCRSYCLLNMFWAPLYPSSGARQYYTEGCCLWYLVFWFSSCRYGVELQPEQLQKEIKLKLVKTKECDISYIVVCINMVSSQLQYIKTEANEDAVVCVVIT